jgi:hypothetical protein
MAPYDSVVVPITATRSKPFFKLIAEAITFFMMLSRYCVFVYLGARRLLIIIKNLWMSS